MAADLGDLVVSVGANISGFSEAFSAVYDGLDNFGAKAQSADADYTNTIIKSLNESGSVWSELAGSLNDATGALDPFKDAAAQVGAAITAATPPAFAFSGAAQEIIDKGAGLNAVADESIAAFNEISEAFKHGTASADDVTRAQGEMEAAIHAANPAVEEAGSKFEGLGESLTEVAGIIGVGIGIEQLVEGIKSLAEESLAAYGKIEMATAALTALTGSSQSAHDILEQMKDIAMSSIFSFPDLVSAAQKMAALGVAASTIPEAMRAVVAAAEVTGNGLDSVSSALDRIYLSATISPRTLTQLGISMTDLAETMGISKDKVVETFKALGPQSDDALQLLTATISRKMADAQEAMTGTLPVTINSLKVTWDSLLEDFGKEIAPSFETLLNALKDVLPLVTSVASGLAGIAASKFADLISTIKAIGIAFDGVSAPLLSVLNYFSTFKTALGGIAETILPLSGIKAIFLDIAAAVDLAKGKYPDYRSALEGVTAATSGLTEKKTADTTATAAQKVAQEAATEAAKAAALHAQAAAAALVAEAENKKLLTEATKLLSAADSQHAADLKAIYVPALLDVGTAELNLSVAKEAAASLDQNLADKETALKDLIQAHTKDNVALQNAEDLLNVARGAAKIGLDQVAQAEKDLAVSKAATKAATTELAGADKDYSDAIKSLHEPAMVSYSEALVGVHDAKLKVKDDADALKQAESELADLIHQKGTVSEDDLKAATERVSTARKTLKTDTDALKTSENDLRASQATLKQATEELRQGTDALDKIYSGGLNQHVADLKTELDNVRTSKDKAREAADNLAGAEAHLKSLVDDTKASQEDVKKATDDAKTAREDLKTKTEELSEKERILQTDFGVSKKTIDDLKSSTDKAKLSAQDTQAALESLGIQPQQHFQDLSDKASTAYATITTNANASITEVREAHIAALKAQADAYTAKGTSVPAAQQVALATLEQQEKDFIFNSSQRWGQLYNDIHADFTGMWTGLTKDFFEGGDFLGTIKTALQHVGEHIIDTLIKPFTDQIDTVLSTVMTNLTTKLSGWLTNAIPGLGISNLNPGGGGISVPGLGGLGSDPGGLPGVGGAPGVDLAGSVSSAVGTTVSSVLTNFVGPISSLVGAVSGVLQLFGVGQGGQKDRLSGIDNATTSMARMMDAGGGQMNIELLNIQNSISNLFDGFGGWYRTQMVNIEEVLDRANEHLTHLDFNVQAWRDSVGGPGPTGAASAATTAPSITVVIQGNVIGNKDFIDQVTTAIGVQLRMQGVLA